MPDSTTAAPPPERPGLSRRRFLGGVGASAAALTVGSVLGTAESASAAYYMKWGAVVSPGDATNNIDFNRKVDILRRMRPQTARISMFWGDPWNRRFSDAQLEALRGTGLTEMIIQSSEDPDPNLARHQLNLMLPYIDAHPNTLFVWELGNEPDWHLPNDPWLARWKRLATIRDNKPTQDRGNLLWAINMPAGRWTGDGSGFTFGTSGRYFDAFVRDTGDGLGGMLSGPYQPDVVTVHCYSSTYLTRGADGGGERNPYKMIDYVRGWNSRISMKVTEAGIDGAKSDRGYRYVNFGSSVANETAGQIDSVCFYGIPPAERQYGIWETEANQIGTHP
ncbi:twin-arginine translocation signal domain-containing protein [Micromonospora coxensis]|uniref:twin-arginine translocation signal domain-containing protein n=1 Tax=Micromonospora coxensis TaxID=356852 RepID=UPI00342F81DF